MQFDLSEAQCLNSLHSKILDFKIVTEIQTILKEITKFTQI